MNANDEKTPPELTIVLASTSPRRRFLLREAGIPVEAVPPLDVAEDSPAAEPPETLVTRHALTKARSVAAGYAGRLILGADTVVVLDDAIFGKPADVAEAHGMLTTLQGKTHTVYSGLALINADGRELTATEATTVAIRDMSDEEIDIYVATGEPLDKAGAYAIQGRGALLVKRVDGDYFNVVGLPLYRLSLMLAAVDYPVFR
jgi:septum formation protein